MIHDDEPKVDDDPEHDHEPEPNPYDLDEPEPSEPACGVCQGALDDFYYTQADTIVCPDCRDAAEAFLQSGSGFVRFTKATALGLMAAFAGAVMMYAFTAITNYQSGLVAIAVGFLVGKAVMRGTNDRGGLKYQALAVFLTYSAVAWSHLPDIAHAFFQQADAAQAAQEVKAPRKAVKPRARADVAEKRGGEVAKEEAELAEPEQEEPVGGGKAALYLTIFLAVIVAFAYISPFLGLPERFAVVGLFLIAFALRQAWTMARKTQVVFHGPFDVGEGTAQADPA